MKVRTPHIDEWNEMLSICQEATFYSTPEWLETVERTYGYRTVPRLFEFSDGQKVLVPLSVMNKLYLLFKQYISVPFYNYGGLLSDSEINADRAGRIVGYLAGRTVLNVTICPHPFSTVRYPDIYKAERYSTHILDLKGGFESVLAKLKENDQVRKINKAIREGVSIREGRSREEYAAYYSMYLDSVKRWGLETPQPYELFENLLIYARNKAKLWLASYKGKDIAGIIAGYCNKIAVYWGGSFFFEYGKLRPNNYLMSEVIRDACANGYEYFDFLPSAGLSGVERFKESFGALKHDYDTYVVNGALFRSRKVVNNG